MDAETAIPRVSRPVAGWGNHPVETCHVYRPERSDELAEIVARAPEPSLIARGLGRSYGDPAMNAGSGVIDTGRLDRMLAFDAETGILHCETAVSLAEILEAMVPRGFFFPVTPGTKYVTLGGAIAADVHGKNHHHSGSMSQHLVDFALLTANGDVLNCSPTENAEVFWATVGGMGLTGLVLEARVKLRPIETAYMRVDYQKARDLDQLLEFIQIADRVHDYGVAWIDCLSRGRNVGRSVLMSANHADPSELRAKAAGDPHRIPAHLHPQVPFTLPNLVLNPYSAAIFNECVYRGSPSGQRIIDCERYFYPLDAVHAWNRVYGQRGALQYQIALPSATAREGIIQILESLSSARRASFLAVLKSFGPADDGLLSFPAEGMTLAIDLPHTGPDLLEQLHHFDQVVLRLGGRVYLAKDACLSAEHFAAMYPNLKQFREIKAKIDPNQRFSSSQARRLEIVDTGAA